MESNMRKVLVIAASAVFAFAPVGVSASPNSVIKADRASKINGPLAGDDYCDSAGRCCPIWLVDNGGFCMDAPIP